MKYSLRSLMIAVLVGPPLLAWGWRGWNDLQRTSELELGDHPLLISMDNRRGANSMKYAFGASDEYLP